MIQSQYIKVLDGKFFIHLLMRLLIKMTMYYPFVYSYSVYWYLFGFRFLPGPYIMATIMVVLMSAYVSCAYYYYYVMLCVGFRFLWAYIKYLI